MLMIVVGLFCVCGDLFVCSLFLFLFFCVGVLVCGFGCVCWMVACLMCLVCVLVNMCFCLLDRVFVCLFVLFHVCVFVFVFV